MGKTILTVVGRSEDGNVFISEISEYFSDNYTIEGVHSLGEFYELDNKERFIAFVVEETPEETESTVEIALQLLRSKGFGAQAHETLEEALEYAKEKYDFEDDEAARQERFAKVREEFPHFTAEEWEQWQVFDSMYHTGRVSPFRGKLNDELVMVLGSMAQGADEIRVTPMAVLINEHVESMLELPFEEE